MRLTRFFILISLTLLILSSCGRQESAEGDVVTRRIQYDVDIQSPEPDRDWWVQNIDGQAREDFVRTILESAYEGKVKAYDIFHNKLSPENVKSIARSTDTITFQRPDPPYELFDTVVSREFEIGDISRIRFLEEWYIDKQSLAMTKKVIGICPLLERYAPDGSLRGYMPMFWVYFDEEYPAIYGLSE